MNEKTNKIKPVTIIGAGPGAFDLLTLRAWNILQNADLVLYDDLAGDEILQKLPLKIEKIYTGKRFGDNQSQSKRLEFIKKEYSKAYKAEKKIVRLKGGDPMVFARTAEEIEFLIKENIDYEIVPGITSGLAAANIFSIPLTIREKIRNLVFTTLSVTENSNSQFSEIEKFLQLGSAILIYMGVNQLKELLEFLTKKGFTDYEVCITSNVSMENQNIVTGKIGDIVNDFENRTFETPAIIILNKFINSYFKDA